MEIRGLFPTPLIIATLDDASLRAKLRATILARAQSTPGVIQSNEGGWQSPPDFLSWSGDEGAALIHALLEIVQHYTGGLVDGQIVRGAPEWRVSAWANVNRAGNTNGYHYHPGNYWSACFYVDDGGIEGEEKLGGALEFSDPRGALPLMYAPETKIIIADCATAGLGERIYPTNGLMVMFPAWLGHRVTAYTGSGVRISITANFSLAPND